MAAIGYSHFILILRDEYNAELCVSYPIEPFQGRIDIDEVTHSNQGSFPRTQGGNL